MNRFEKSAFIAFVIGACVAGSFWLTGRSLVKTRVLETMNGRLIFTSASYVRPDGPPARLLMDGDPRSGLPDLNSGRYGATDSGAAARGDEDLTAWSWTPTRPFVQLQVGLTHSPDRPPRPNPLRAMRIWSGDRSTPDAFAKSARPKTIRLVFFRQQVVDLDREYRLPEEPVFWRERVVRLRDLADAQRIDLGFLDEPPESPGFPREVQQIWLRLEILDYYPGNQARTRDAIALSELEFEFRQSPRRGLRSRTDS